ncbi:hypothetical protein FRC12_017892 [Ceratobasidium sp. 428]|nr:hypothetical protein FRC12_017892 [Ceratobasidium sp. 428]
MFSYRRPRKALPTASPLFASPISCLADLSAPHVLPSEPPAPLSDVVGVLAVGDPVDNEPVTELPVLVAVPSIEGDVLEGALVDVEAEPVNSPGNSVEALVSGFTRTTEEKMLGVGIWAPQEEPSTYGEIGGPRTWFPPRIPSTGTPIIDRVLEDLRVSRYCFWLGDLPHVGCNCLWRGNSTRRNVSYLQWKDYGGDDDRKDGGGEDCGGDVMLGMIGMVSFEGNNTSPDAGWQPGFGSEKLYKYNRTLHIVLPDSKLNIPQACCLAQFEGAYGLVQGGMPPGGVAHCFVDREDGFMRFRSPIFTPALVVPDNGEYDTTHNSSLEDDNLPPGFGFDNWKMSSPLVEAHFRQVVDSGYKPQPFPAYNRFGKLIHPNQVSTTLAGAIVLVYFTLERIRYPKEKGVRTECQFYGNLVRLQVLKLASPKPVLKRSAGEPACKKPKFSRGGLVA